MRGTKVKRWILRCCYLLLIAIWVLPNLVACGSKGSMPDSGDIEYRGNTSGAGAPGAVTATNYDAIDYEGGTPEGYAIYTYVLISRSDERAEALLSEIFRTTTALQESKLNRKNINLLMIPAKRRDEMRAVFGDARALHETVARAVLFDFYDFGFSELLFSQACEDPVLQDHCNSPGPFLLTVEVPFDRQIEPGRKLLTDISSTHVDAIPEVIGDYKKQVKKPDAFSVSWKGRWRLAALNAILTAADYAPMISKVYADYSGN